MWDQMLRLRRQGPDLPIPLWLRRALAAESELWVVPIIVLPIYVIWRKVMRSWVDYDWWWHVSSGNWTLDNGRVPSTDPFSWTRGGENWINHSWLADVILALTNRIGGYTGTALLVTAVAVAGFWRLLQGARYYGLSRRMLCVLMLLWGGIPLWGLAVRPQVLGWALFGVLLVELAGYETGNRRRLWLLPPLFVLWVNLHMSAFIGAGVLLVFAVGRIARRQPDRHLLIVCALCLVALLINPRGLQLAALAASYLRPGAIRHDFIWEFQSPSLNEAPLRVFWLATPMALVALWYLVQRLWPPAWMPIVVLGTLAASLRAERYIPFYGIALIPFAGWIAWNWAQRRAQERARALPRSERRDPRFVPPTAVLRHRGALLQVGPRILGASALVTVLLMAFVASRGPSQFGRTPKPWGFPTATVNALLEQYPTARIFNSYSYGGYLIYKLYPQMKVFVDNRDESYGDAFIRTWLSLIRGEPGWQNTFADLGVNAVLVERNSGIAYALDADPGWRVAQVDDVSALWVRALRPQDCAREPSLRAGAENGQATSVEFANNGSAPLRLYRLDSAGRRQPVDGVAPGGASTQQTYDTQPWVVTNVADECLGVVQPMAIPGSVSFAPLAAPPAPGTWLAISTFDDPAKSVLPPAFSDRYGQAGIIAGEYSISRTEPNFAGNWTMYLPGAYADTSLNVAVRLLGPTDGRAIEIRCRTELLPNGGVNGYALQVEPARSAFYLVRLDNKSRTVLVQGQTPAIASPLERNSLELTCVGNRLAANINGAPLAIVVDNAYRQGRLGIGLVGVDRVFGFQEARFDDLVVTQR